MPSRSAPRNAKRAPRLSHVESRAGAARARMVAVGEKPVTARSATARAQVRFPRGMLARVLREGGPKGPVIEVARVAAIQAAKRTAEWIPMCHTLALDEVVVDVRPKGADVLEITCRAACHGRTGVEMEALVGASACALVVYDMTKALSHEIAIERVELVHKAGGKSGEWTRSSGSRSTPKRRAGSGRAGL
jgi:cyclic pyranopterin phosphate synthase